MSVCSANVGTRFFAFAAFCCAAAIARMASEARAIRYVLEKRSSIDAPSAASVPRTSGLIR
jgi:hypothetical protein